MADQEPDNEDGLAVKRWLQQRREQLKLSKDDLAWKTGQSGRAVHNAESLDNRSLPHGWPFYKMLRTLGLLADDAPASNQPTLDERLQSIEEKLDLLIPPAEPGEEEAAREAALAFREAEILSDTDDDQRRPRRSRRASR